VSPVDGERPAFGSPDVPDVGVLGVGHQRGRQEIRRVRAERLQLAVHQLSVRGSTSDGLAMVWSSRSGRTAVPMAKNSVV